MKVLPCLFFICILFFSSNNLHAQWIQTNGPCGGETMALVINGTDLYAGFNGGGIWRSSDGCKSWTDVSMKFGSRYISTLFSSGPYIWAGTPENNPPRHLFYPEDNEKGGLEIIINFLQIIDNSFPAKAQI